MKEEVIKKEQIKSNAFFSVANIYLLSFNN